jgi:hypothetical protein
MGWGAVEQRTFHSHGSDGAFADGSRGARCSDRGRAPLARGASQLDGGWGDTVKSKSNISTTALVWAAFGAAQADEQFPAVVAGARAWLESAAGGVANLIPAIERRYGKDRTFSVPILMTCVLGGRLGEDAWTRIPRLPFEVAVLPHQLFGALRLPVVSYALPALIAIGQLLHERHPSSNRLLQKMREASRGPTLAKLATLQPENGGFLEATPLTSFVTMSLAALGLREHLVARRGVEFLQKSVLPDGSWPIDTNLATWVTTLSIKALAHQRGALPAKCAGPAPQLASRAAVSGGAPLHPRCPGRLGVDRSPWWRARRGRYGRSFDCAGPARRDGRRHARGWRTRGGVAAGLAEFRWRHSDLLPRLGRAAF